MKASTKIGIGLSIAAVASVSVAVIASEKIIKKVSHVSNRYKVKKFVDDNLMETKNYYRLSMIYPMMN